MPVHFLELLQQLKLGVPPDIIMSRPSCVCCTPFETYGLKQINSIQGDECFLPLIELPVLRSLGFDPFSQLYIATRNK